MMRLLQMQHNPSIIKTILSKRSNDIFSVQFQVLNCIDRLTQWSENASAMHNHAFGLRIAKFNVVVMSWNHRNWCISDSRVSNCINLSEQRLLRLWNWLLLCWSMLSQITNALPQHSILYCAEVLSACYNRSIDTLWFSAAD